MDANTVTQVLGYVIGYWRLDPEHACAYYAGADLLDGHGEETITGGAINLFTSIRDAMDSIREIDPKPWSWAERCDFHIAAVVQDTTIERKLLLDLPTHADIERPEGLRFCLTSPDGTKVYQQISKEARRWDRLSEQLLQSYFYSDSLSVTRGVRTLFDIAGIPTQIRVLRESNHEECTEPRIVRVEMYVPGCPPEDEPFQDPNQRELDL